MTLGVCAASASIGLGLWTGLWPGGEAGAAPPAAGTAVTSTAPSPATTEVATTEVAPRASTRAGRTPVQLDIPAIGLSTRLLRLGLEQDHSVEVPADADRAGWFEPGTTPGAAGSAVILGHVDSATGPAVFARLRDLEPGDLVQVRRSNGSAVTFTVQRLALYPNAEFPARRVYAAPQGRRLNLVTCAGDYDVGKGGYQSNLVVYARRVPEPPPASAAAAS